MKRALIIAYYWPPAGGPGVQRWLKFVTYLSDFGIEPVVVVPDNPHYPIEDPDLLRECPTDIELIKLPIKEPYGIAKRLSSSKTKAMSSGIVSEKKTGLLGRFMLWVRGNFFIPDARVGWVKPTVAFLSEYLKTNSADIIITTGPPHSVHLIGRRLKKEIGIPWMADFRDPWTTIHYHDSLRMGKRAKAKHKKLEAAVLQECNRVVVTSPGTKREFEDITNRPVDVITNGYEASVDIKANLDAKFSLVHIGSLLSERNPEVLWKVLSDLNSEIKGFNDHLEIKLIGTISASVMESIEVSGLGAYCILPGYVSHSEALQAQHNARMLLLIEMDKPETKVIIPGKLFEYMAAKRPILAVGPMGSDVEELLHETQSGTFHSYADYEAIKSTITAWYQRYLEENDYLEVRSVEKYSRKGRTSLLAESIAKTLS